MKNHRIGFDRRPGQAVPALFAALLAFVPLSLHAGAPFVTDDPGTPENFEINFAVQYGHSAGQTVGAAPSLEVNYTAVVNVQLHLLMPLAFSHASGDRTRWGYGDTELGIKYRFFDPQEGDWFPAAAIFPLLLLPTGDEERELGSGHTRAFLPLWLGGEFGAWNTFGGGGYWLNPGDGNRNYWFVGIGVTRKVTDGLKLGGEIFHVTRSETDGKEMTGFNLGGIYDISDRHHILVSAGRGIENASETNEFTTYVAYQLTF